MTLIMHRAAECHQRVSGRQRTRIARQQHTRICFRGRCVRAAGSFQEGGSRVKKEAIRIGERIWGRAERTAGRVGERKPNSLSHCRVRESWQEVDSRYRVSNRLKHSRDDIQRMLPHWRRRFRDFSQSRTGRVTLWAGFVYSIVSGLLFRVLSVLFLLWWVVPLVLIPFMRKNIAKAQEQGYGSQGRAAGFGGSTPQGFGRQGGGGFGGARNRSKGPSQGQGQVIEAEWSTIDSDDARRR